MDILVNELIEKKLLLELESYNLPHIIKEQNIEKHGILSGLGYLYPGKAIQVEFGSTEELFYIENGLIPFSELFNDILYFNHFDFSDKTIMLKYSFLKRLKNLNIIPFGQFLGYNIYEKSEPIHKRIELDDLFSFILSCQINYKSYNSLYLDAFIERLENIRIARITSIIG